MKRRYLLSLTLGELQAIRRALGNFTAQASSLECAQFFGSPAAAQCAYKAFEKVYKAITGREV